MQCSVLRALMVPMCIKHNCMHPACTLLAPCVGSSLYLHKHDCTKHSQHNLKASMQSTVAATSERVATCRALSKPAVGVQVFADAGRVIQQLQVRTRLRTPATWCLFAPPLSPSIAAGHLNVIAHYLLCEETLPRWHAFS